MNNYLGSKSQKPKGMLGGHQNIQSLKSKSDQINHILLESNLDFLCLTETWLHKNSPSAALIVPGYDIYRRDRTDAKGGGVMIYVRNTIYYNEIQLQNPSDLECVALNMIISPQMSYTIVVIYRPPSSNISFYKKLKTVLCQLDFKKEIIIMGDFNLKCEDK